MGLFILDQEKTNEDMVFNNLTEDEINKSCEQMSEILENVELGIEPTLINVGGAYVTSKGNAVIYEEIYGWQFSEEVVIVEM